MEPTNRSHPIGFIAVIWHNAIPLLCTLYRTPRRENMRVFSCSVFQCVAVYYIVMHCVWHLSIWKRKSPWLQCVAVCCGVLLRNAKCVTSQHMRTERCWIAACCSVLHCAAVCCSVLQCVAVCCSVLQRIIECMTSQQHAHVRLLACVAVCCSVLQWITSVLQCVAVCCSVLQFITIYDVECTTSQQHKHTTQHLRVLTSSCFKHTVRCCLNLGERVHSIHTLAAIECSLVLIAVCCSLLQCVGSVLQCVVVCCVRCELVLFGAHLVLCYLQHYHVPIWRICLHM